MQLKITAELLLEDSVVGTSQLNALRGMSVLLAAFSDGKIAIDQPQVIAKITPEAIAVANAMAEKIREQAQQATAPQEVVSAPEVQAPTVVANADDKLPTIDEVLKGTTLKPTAAGTSIAGDPKIVAKAGDEVHDKKGLIGVVRQTYRGKVAVEFDDGSGRIYAAEDLQLVPQGDQDKPEPDPLADDGEQEEVPVEVTAEMLRETATRVVELVNSKGRSGGREVTQVFVNNAGCTKIGQIPEGQRAVVYEALLLLEQEANAIAA